jgi:murein L,D-transpeptidase YcbB/YkuD
MWDSVSQAFGDFSRPLEGEVPWTYQDPKGLVTIGIGNLIDPVALALAVPSYGAEYYDKAAPDDAVTDAQIRADWERVKNDPSLKGNWRAAEPVTQLRLRSEDINTLVARKAAEFETYMVSHVAAFANFPNWPADAQLGLLSMAWAMGPAFADAGRWPNFRAACANEDWFGAAANCHMVNDWLVKRNAVNRGLFRNAAWSALPPPSDPSQLLLPVGAVYPTIQRGQVDSGDETYVGSLQQWLAFLGYSVEQTGAFDDATYEVVVAFQRDEGFTRDGKVGQLTWAALGFMVPTN